MIDHNKKDIQQLLYTAGGKTPHHTGDGAFGIYSLSSGLTSDDCTDIRNFIGVVKDLNTYNIKPTIIREKVLKAGAKKNLFGRYKDDDYEYLETEARSAIEVLEDSDDRLLKKLREVDEKNKREGKSERSDASLRNLLPDQDKDYRNSPEQAPYRIAACRIADGRILVAKVTYVNRVYSDLDARTGNFFAHVYIFPEGTEISDIKKIYGDLDFQSGLSSDQWGENAKPAPRFLPDVSVNDILRHQPSKRARVITGGNDRLLNADELLTLYKRSQDESLSPQERNNCLIEFRNQVKKGANISEVLKKLKMEELTILRKGGKITNSFVDEIWTEFYSFSPYSKIYDYYLKSVKEKVDSENREQDGDEQGAKSLEASSKNSRDSGKMVIRQVGAEATKKAMESLRDFEVYSYSCEQVKRGRPVDGYLSEEKQKTFSTILIDVRQVQSEVTK